jgi:hypothetical protein
MPALGLSSYHQLLHDLASAGLGPCECDSTNTDASTGTGSEEP